MLKYREVTYQNHPLEGIAIKDDIISKWLACNNLRYIRIDKVSAMGIARPPFTKSDTLANEFMPMYQSSLFSIYE